MAASIRSTSSAAGTDPGCPPAAVSVDGSALAGNAAPPSVVKHDPVRDRVHQSGGGVALVDPADRYGAVLEAHRHADQTAGVPVLDPVQRRFEVVEPTNGAYGNGIGTPKLIRTVWSSTASTEWRGPTAAGSAVAACAVRHELGQVPAALDGYRVVQRRAQAAHRTMAAHPDAVGRGRPPCSKGRSRAASARWKLTFINDWLPAHGVTALEPLEGVAGLDAGYVPAVYWTAQGWGG